MGRFLEPEKGWAAISAVVASSLKLKVIDQVIDRPNRMSASIILPLESKPAVSCGPAFPRGRGVEVDDSVENRTQRFDVIDEELGDETHFDL